MAKVLFQFKWHWDDERFRRDEPAAPLFTRWLPNGERDAVRLLETEQEQLTVWFERHGESEHSFIRYVPGKTNFDATIIPRQGKLNAGHLYIRLLLNDCSEEEVAALGNLLFDSPIVLALQGRVISLTEKPLATFIDTLRTRFGQFWLDQLTPYDSRVYSASEYLLQLSATFSVDEGMSWRRVVPTSMSIQVSASVSPAENYEQYMTKEDWEFLQVNGKVLQPPTLAAILISTTLELFQEGAFRQAYVEATSVLELAISMFIKSKAVGLDPKLFQSFFQLPLPSQTTVALSMSGLATESEINALLQCVRIRNLIVHEGLIPSGSAALEILTCLKVAARMIGHTNQKLPTLDSGNILHPPH